MDDLYQETILEEFAHPRHFGQLAEADATIPGINPSCGDALTLYLKFAADQQHIAQLKWEGDGCAISTSAMSVLAEKINQEHLTPEQIANLEQKDLEAMLRLPEITSGRVKCLTLGLHTLQSYFAQPQTNCQSRKK